MRNNLNNMSGGRFFIGLSATLVSIALLSACATQQPSNTPKAPLPQDASSQSLEQDQNTTSDQADSNQTGSNVSDKDTCGADPLKLLIGKSIAAVTMPASQNVRVIGVNTPVTRDYRADRINILINETAIITKVYCG